ncbi:acyl-CoA dehydrogenase family protein [Verrucosispora sioxanthis]|uniref:acyl-CoA dehydrogenase family protein n=1 Tax=Verrucosispora sioxanthis TaxID=2499994 RepID=UPI001F18D50C|nr:acyl-CoA dehydrogenase family protein [Verrucosispora sioxanthis]
MTDLLYDADEEALRDSVRALLAAHAPWQRILAAVDADEPYDGALWRRLVDQTGVTGLAVPVEHGGAGAGFREVAVVLEELGRAVAPVPFLGTVVATRALLACGESTLLRQVAAAERDVALAVGLATAPDADPGPVTLGPGPTLSGRVLGWLTPSRTACCWFRPPTGCTPSTAPTRRYAGLPWCRWTPPDRSSTSSSPPHPPTRSPGARWPRRRSRRR